MLLNKQILIFGIVFLLLISAVSADVCEVNRIKDVLKKILFLYYIEPSSVPLTKDEVKDMLVFYLSINNQNITVDCSAFGSRSNKPISDMVNRGDNAPDKIPACPDGTKYGECSKSRPAYCYAGTINGKCEICGCPINSVCGKSGKCETTGQNITCFKDIDCGRISFTGSYYCMNNYIARDALNYTCANPGTLNSKCVSTNNIMLLTYCNPNLNQSCVNGQIACVIPATNASTTATNQTNQTTNQSNQTSKPDLIASDMTFKPLNPTTSDVLYINITVKNIGVAAASSSVLRVDGAAQSWRLSVPIIPASASYSWQISSSFSAGNYTFAAQADADNAVSEIDENNNLLSGNIAVISAQNQTANQTNQTQPDSCLDSDNGIYPYAKGFAAGYQKGVLVNLSDYCAGSTNYIYEAYCGTNITYQITACSYQCSNGACINQPTTNQTTTNQTCTDSDGGRDYYVKGTATGSINAYDYSTDICSGNYVTESYCLNGSRAQESYLCPGGCSNGACITQTTTTNQTNQTANQTGLKNYADTCADGAECKSNLTCISDPLDNNVGKCGWWGSTSTSFPQCSAGYYPSTPCICGNIAIGAGACNHGIFYWPPTQSGSSVGSSCADSSQCRTGICIFGLCSYAVRCHAQTPGYCHNHEECVAFGASC